MTNYRCIVTLRSGAHKILRMTRDVVAHVVAEFRKMQHCIFNDRVTVNVGGYTLTLNDVTSLKFMNEYTGEEFLTVY